MEVDFVHINDWPWGRSWDFIVDGGVCFGRASLLNKALDEIYIDNVSVYRDFRRQGYGRFLLDRIEYMAEITLSVKRLRLWVDACKPENVAFYEACGFHQAGFVDDSEDMIVMLKEL